ncbi:MAG: hypothetical protein M3076_12570 [Actinomycetota bacterium]|nr:hypothetical protein [Actinomycetota bacterium]
MIAPALGAIVETTTLLKVIAYSLLFGLGIAVVFGIGVWSAGGLIDSVRTRRTAASAAWGVIAGVCAIAVLAVIVPGIVVMSAK